MELCFLCTHTADFRVWPIAKIGGNTVERFEDDSHKKCCALFAVAPEYEHFFYIAKNSFGKTTFLLFWLNYD